jgi:hypothetical protein
LDTGQDVGDGSLAGANIKVWLLKGEGISKKGKILIFGDGWYAIKVFFMSLNS